MEANLSVIDVIKSKIRRDIEQGIYTEGDKVPSELELAAEYRVGRAQSRQALRDLESEGYIQRSRGRRSEVTPMSNWPGRVLHSTGAGIAAIAVPTCQSLYCRRLVEGFSARVAESDFQTISYNLSFDLASEVQFLSHLRRLGVSMVALWLQHESEETLALLRDLAQCRMPLVLVDHRARGLETDFVTTDNETLGYGLTRRLLEKGHRRIGFLQDFYSLTSSEERHQGYLRALCGAGLEADPACSGMFDPGARPDSARMLEGIMARKEKPTAFYCTHDSLALAAAELFSSLGYDIPGDIELATSDDDEYSRARGIPMVTAMQPGLEIGRAAAEILLARQAEPARPPDQRRIAPVLS